VVVRCSWGGVALMVDEIHDMVTLSLAESVPVPETINESVRAIMHSVYNLPDRLLLILDTQRTVDVTSQTGMDLMPTAASIRAVSQPPRGVLP